MSETRAHVGDFQAEKWGVASFSASERDGGFPHCSYCGSIDVESAIRLLETPGAGFSGSDWKYGWPHKFYLDAPNPRGGLFVVGGLYRGGKTELGPENEGKDYVRVDQLNEEQRRIAIRDGAIGSHPLRRAGDKGARDWIQFGKRDHFHLKFYTVHLKDVAPDVVARFSELSNAALGVAFTLDEKGLAWSAPRGIQRWGKIGEDGKPIHEDPYGDGPRSTAPASP